jgi:hypothetical protein
MKFRMSGFSDRGLRRRAGAAFAKADGGPLAQGAFAFATYSRSSGAPAGTPPPRLPWPLLKAPVRVAALRLDR